MKFTMIFIKFLGIFLLASCFPVVKSSPSSLFFPEANPRSKSPAKCQYGKSHSLKEVVCDGLNLEEIPDLQSDIEILNFSGNRLKEITNDTLKKYSELVFVIIQTNRVFTIDTGAFAAQEDTLKGIDLLDNDLSTFPMDILKYPNFIRLYLGKNYLEDAALDYPIESSLEIFDLFNNKLTKLPTKLSLPELTHLNVSGNKIMKIKPEELAHFCSLTVLDINKNPLKMSGCECKALKKWIDIRKISTTPKDIKCNPCPLLDNDLSMLNDSFKIYDKCRENKSARNSVAMKLKNMKFASFFWYIILLIVVIILIIIVICSCHCSCTCEKRNSEEGNLKKNGKLVIATNGGIKNQSDKDLSTKNASVDEFQCTRL